MHLSDFDSVVACADTRRGMQVNIDMQVLNAGIILAEGLRPLQSRQRPVLAELSQGLRNTRATLNCLTPGPVDTHRRRRADTKPIAPWRQNCGKCRHA